MIFLNITNATKNMAVNKIKDFFFENYYKRIGFSKESSYLMENQKKRSAIVCN